MPDNGRKWDRRIARARELAETYPFAREFLLFYSRLALFQKSSYLQYRPASISGSHGRDSLPATLDEIEQLLLRWRPFLSLLEAQAPGPLAEFARKFKANDVAAASALLRAAWPTPGEIMEGDALVPPGGRVPTIFDGLAVPEVDDLAAVPLDLWADENGYHRVTRNLLCF